jgi:hypothetical protein
MLVALLRVKGCLAVVSHDCKIAENAEKSSGENAGRITQFAISEKSGLRLTADRRQPAASSAPPLIDIPPNPVTISPCS